MCNNGERIFSAVRIRNQYFIRTGRMGWQEIDRERKEERIRHRIIDDWIEKSIKGRRIRHNLRWSGVKGEGGRAGIALAHPPTTPSPHTRPGVGYIQYVVCGCCRASTTARANALTQIVPNSSSLKTLFYSVIYNSVKLDHKKENCMNCRTQVLSGTFKSVSHDIVLGWILINLIL